MENHPSVELLESTHQFPGTYHIKAIGVSDDDFVERVISAASSELASPSDIDYSVRITPGGRHVALTLVLNVQPPQQVRAVYEKIAKVEGLTLLF
jgi:putative lipoic acid-binding regulatory protein